MTTKRLIEAKNVNASDIAFGNMTSHVSRNTNVSYQRIPITYKGGPLVNKGFSNSRLEKLGSCFWQEKILYAGIVESIYDSSLNSRYFINDEEVERVLVGESSEYDAVAAIVVDSIYVGEKAISIQVKLYEVSLTPSKKRDRVL